ncbi:hypothetical protein TrispH2_008889 [Trichoplax sp. H2]|nr:hypothetical protein TrispH2_008889 [Trichoplax sp. H2]|eukprot:RDD39298.1 hypothetical protein TrispH2_008889 [Trichoplax sp. H2]
MLIETGHNSSYLIRSNKPYNLGCLKAYYSTRVNGLEEVNSLSSPAEFEFKLVDNTYSRIILQSEPKLLLCLKKIEESKYDAIFVEIDRDIENITKIFKKWNKKDPETIIWLFNLQYYDLDSRSTIVHLTIGQNRTKLVSFDTDGKVRLVNRIIDFMPAESDLILVVR